MLLSSRLCTILAMTISLVLVQRNDGDRYSALRGFPQDVLDAFPEGNDTTTYHDPFPMASCRSRFIEEVSIAKLQRLLLEDRLTSRQLVECYTERIARVNVHIKAILELNPDAKAIADGLDRERAEGRIRGSLHGILFVVKDNIATVDRMQTATGSLALVDSVVPRDAHTVHLLHEAGALLLGHASLSEWADMRSNVYSEGYSTRGGQTRSFYNGTLMPGGSSTGSATAVAANMGAFAPGTETDGSVINPAQRSSVVGLNPTLGLVSRAGVIPESEHFDTVGVFGRTVAGAATVLGAIVGVDERDNYTQAQLWDAHTGRNSLGTDDAASFIVEERSSDSPRNHFGYMRDRIHFLVCFVQFESEEAGGCVINGTEIPNYRTIVAQDGWDCDWGAKRGRPNESEYTVVKIDFYNNIRTYIADLRNTTVHSLEDLVAFNCDNDDVEGGTPGVHPAFASGQDGFLASLETRGVKDATHWQALKYLRRTAGKEGIDAAPNHRFPDGTVIALNGLLVPSDVGQTTSLAAQAGYPMVTIPTGVNLWGMPFGLGILHTAWSERLFIKWASAIEALVRGRRAPTWYNYDAKNILIWDEHEMS